MNHLRTTCGYCDQPIEPRPRHWWQLAAWWRWLWAHNHPDEWGRHLRGQCRCVRPGEWA